MAILNQFCSFDHTKSHKGKSSFISWDSTRKDKSSDYVNELACTWLDNEDHAAENMALIKITILEVPHLIHIMIGEKNLREEKINSSLIDVYMH